MAIHIDIYAHLRDRELIKEGEQLRQYINSLERDANQRAIKGAQGRSKKIVAAQDKVATAYDHIINKIDEFILALRRLEEAENRIEAINSRVTDDAKERQKNEDDLQRAIQARAAAEQDLTFKAQALTKATRDETRAVADLNKENLDYTENLRAVTRIANVNAREFTQLSRTTKRLRQETENLHTANAGIVRDNAKVAAGMRSLSDATKKTSRERKKYGELRKQEGVTARQLEQQALRVIDAHEAEDRALQNVKSSIVDVIRLRSNHDAVVQQNAQSLRDLNREAIDSSLRAAKIRADKKADIEQSAATAKAFDRIDTATQRVVREYQKFNDMSRDGSVTSAALAAQVWKVNDAYVAQQAAIEDASVSLDQYYKKQEEAERRAEEAARKAEEAIRAQHERDRIKFMGRQSPGQYLARNLGALTPLGTVSPSALIPLAGVLGTIGEAAVTASQSLALIPAGIGAVAAGIGTLTVGMWGFGDALQGMSDPKKFAEALYTLSPNAQQAALSIKNLVDGPLGDLKRATQEALFANTSPIFQQLAQTFGPTIQRMTTSIATSFNQMFTGASMQFMTPEMQQRVTAISDNIAAMFDRIRPGMMAFTDAFMRIAQTGSGFLPQLADGFSRLMITFDNFIARAQADGSLQNFMQKGIDAVAVLGQFLLQFGQDIYEVFGNKTPEDFMNTLNSIRNVVVVLFKAFTAFAAVLDFSLPIMDGIVSALGGWEVAMSALIGLFLGRGIWNFYKWIKDVLTYLPLIGPSAVKGAQGIGALSTAATVAAGGAATTAAAKRTAADTAATFADAGTKAGKGFTANLKSVITGFSWVGIGIGIAEAIELGIRSFKSPNNSADTNKTLDSLADGFDPGKVFNPEYWIDKFFPNLRNPRAPSAVGDSGNFYKDWYPAGENPATPALPEPPPTDIPPGYPGYPGYEFSGPDVPIDPRTGKALTDTEIMNKLRGEIPREQYAVDPFVDPITGQKLTPMLPVGPNGMPQFPAGGVPGTPSIKGPIMPQYNSFGQLTGYGANMVDPEEVFDAELAVRDRATDLEEAKKDLIAGQMSNLLSEEEIHELERKVLDAKIALHKSLRQLGKAQTGDVEKLKTETEKAADALGEFGAEIDKDFGISKGLPGIAENITKFLANLAFAPAFGAIRGAQAGLGFPQGEGAGSGLTGMIASSLGYYKGGPLDPNPPEGQKRFAPGYENYVPDSGYYPITLPEAASPVYSPPEIGPQPGGVGYGSGPGVNRAKLSGINLSTIPVAAQQYANNCIDAAAQIILSASGVSMTQDQIEKTIARGGSISSLSAGLNRLNPAGGYVALEGSGGSPEALYSAVQNSVNRGIGGILNVAPGSSIAGRPYPYGHFIAITGYDPKTGRINLSDTADGSMYSVTAGEAFAASRGRGMVAGTGIPQRHQPQYPQYPQYPQQNQYSRPIGPGLPHYAKGGEVPIMAHSGEHVLTREDVSALGGQAGVYAFRRSLHRYENGGEPKPPDLGSLLGVGDSPSALAPNQTPDWSPAKANLWGGRVPGTGESYASAPPAVPAPPTPPPPPAPPKPPEPPAMPGADAPLGPPLAAEAPDLPVPPAQVGQIPQTALPGGVETPGTVIGAQVEAPQGYGQGLSIGGGIIGAIQGAAQTALQAGGLAADAAGGGGGASAGAAVASAALQIGFEEMNRAIEFAGQAAAIGVQGLMETWLPAGGSELAQNNWLTRFAGGIAGAAPTIANLAGGAGASNQGVLAGVGGPPTPEQVAAQGMDPSRSQHTGTGPAPGPYTGVHIQNYVVAQNEDRAGQDLARYQPAPGAR